MEPASATSGETKNDGTKPYRGGCHCGAVRFEASLDLGKGGARCNCSICTKVAPLGALANPASLTVLSGEEHLTAYEWGAKISQRYFCRICGVYCFGRGHLAVLGGDFASINVNCLDDVELTELKVIYWDGRHDNWQAGPRPEPWPLFTQP